MTKTVKKVTKIKKGRALSLVLIVLAIISIIIGGVFAFDSYRTHKKNNEIKERGPVIERAEYKSPDYESSLKLVAVGDALIHSSIYADAYKNGKYDFNYIFTEIKDRFKDYDLKYYNQETILGGTSLGLSSYPLFNSPQEVGDAFMNMGFNLVSLATNHSLDYGASGLKNSLAYWGKQEGVIAAGSYESEEERKTPRIMEMNGITYTMLSYSTLTNGLTIPYGQEYLFDYYNASKVKADIERLRDKVDVLIVAMHWGEEYTHTPVREEREIAKYLADLGVDIIIGCHPHVIQPIEFIGDTMVIYSLGNFLSGQHPLGIATITGLMASVTIKKTVINGVSTITLEEPTAELVYTKANCSGNYCNSFKLYPYSKLNNSILYNYEYYYNYFMNIATGGSSKIKKVPLK